MQSSCNGCAGRRIDKTPGMWLVKNDVERTSSHDMWLIVAYCTLPFPVTVKVAHLSGRERSLLDWCEAVSC